MNFPYDDEDDTESSETIESIPKEYEIDFNTGLLTGRVVEGLDAVKTWAWLALHARRYVNECHTWDYGQEFDDLIGQGYSQEYIESEMERMILECLEQNEHITGISDLTVSFDSDNLTAEFTIDTDYGEVEANV